MSKRTSTSPFTSSSAKDYIRHEVDYAFIQSFRNTYYPDVKLRYLGLPGEELRDVLSWREFIGYCTAVENAGVAEVIELNILRNRLDGIVHPVYADIDDLFATELEQARLHWPYHLVNLDYIGGLVNASVVGSSRSSRRIEAIKALFAQQANVAFILLLTLNLRDNDQGELDCLVDNLEESLSDRDPEVVKECFESHRQLGHAGRLKIYVPAFLLNVAKQHSLKFLPPILYQGTRQMIHFAVQCIPYTEMAAGRIITNREHIALINQPLLLLHNYGELKQVQLGFIPEVVSTSTP